MKKQFKKSMLTVAVLSAPLVAGQFIEVNEASAKDEVKTTQTGKSTVEAKKQGWIKDGNTWYYYDANGQMKKNGWQGDYYLGSDGKMVTNSWIGKYHVDANGYWDKSKGWEKRGNVWYYYDDNGQMKKNSWQGDYYLGSDGKMVTNSWVGKYHVDANGKWDSTKEQGWVKSGSSWYYYDANGQMKKNSWQGDYYLGSDGKMATNAWVDGGKYHVDANGKWDNTKSTQNAGQLALKYVGTPYAWGGSSPSGFDCSGLVQYVYKQAGKNLPRTTSQQEYSGTVISVNQAQAGDLIFWGSRGSTYHVAIALGGGQYVHAPAPGQTVKVQSVSSAFMPSFAVRL